MPIDDDRQLADEVEAALKALGIARPTIAAAEPVQPHVLDLKGTKRPATPAADDGATEPGSHSPGGGNAA